MPRIYTRTGDDGQTGLFGGDRVQKNDPRMEAIGAVDELNAALGLVQVELRRSENPPAGVGEFCERVQHQLFNLGAELAMPRQSTASASRLQEADVAHLETAIDRWETDLEPLREFILPGGCAAAAQLHFARAVCRRAERMLVGLAQADPQLRGELLRYINRLSDALFVAARVTNRAVGVTDVKWRSKS
jgi:cob(I)alamin adenosyltransferase